MLIPLLNTLPFVIDYMNMISSNIEIKPNDKKLTSIGSKIIGFIISGIILYAVINYEDFGRNSLNKYKADSISKLIRRLNRNLFEAIFLASIRGLINKFDLTDGVLVLDDTDNKRSKRTKRIHAVQKIKDKSTSGYMQGQSMGLLL